MKRRRSGGEDQDRRVLQKTENNCCISTLSPALMVEIFVKLPLFDLMQCKKVCRTWKEILTEYSFSDAYERISSFTHFLRPNVVRPLIRSVPDTSFYRANLIEISDNGDCIERQVKVKLPVWQKGKPTAFVIGSCNGLLSLSLYCGGVERIIVSNPLMKLCIELPKHERHYDDRFLHHKIGFSPSLKKIKVLRIGYKHNSMVEDTEIFTVGVDSRWRRLSCFFAGSCFLDNCVSVNGILYWIIEDSGFKQIYRFDLEEEKGGRISHPPRLFLDSNTMNLVVFNHKLSLIDYSVPCEITIWTMSEYAVVKNWTKDVILRSWFPSDVKSNKLVPIQKLKNGDIVFGHVLDFIFFNAKKMKCSKFEANNYQKNWIEVPSFQLIREARMKGQMSIIKY